MISAGVRRILSGGYSGHTVTQGQVPGSTEAGDTLLIVTKHLISQSGAEGVRWGQQKQPHHKSFFVCSVAAEKWT